MPKNQMKQKMKERRTAITFSIELTDAKVKEILASPFFKKAMDEAVQIIFERMKEAKP